VSIDHAKRSNKIPTDPWNTPAGTRKYEHKEFGNLGYVEVFLEWEVEPTNPSLPFIPPHVWCLEAQGKTFFIDDQIYFHTWIFMDM